ncbi:MAG: hypothetical protein ABJE95_15710 [Byssovorax sp.]
MSVVRRSLRCAWPLGLLLASSPALAAPSARLVYVREAEAESCADEEGLRRAVATRLGYDPFFAWAKVTVVARVRKEVAAYRADVTLVDEAGVSRGQREITSPGDDCAPLGAALALTISLALDPLSLAPKPAPIAPTPPVIDPPIAPPDLPPPSIAPVPVAPPIAPIQAVSAAPEWRGWLGISALGSYGATPGIALGGALRGTLARGRFSLGVEVRADAPTTSSATTGAAVKAWLAQSTLLGCGRAAIVVGCGFVSAGPLVATGIVAVPHSAVLPYGAAGPRIGVEWPLGARFQVEGFTQVGFALARRALQIDGVDVYRQPVAAFSAGVAVSLRIF